MNDKWTPSALLDRIAAMNRDNVVWMTDVSKIYESESVSEWEEPDQ